MKCLSIFLSQDFLPSAAFLPRGLSCTFISTEGIQIIAVLFSASKTNVSTNYINLYLRKSAYFDLSFKRRIIKKD